MPIYRPMKPRSKNQPIRVSDNGNESLAREEEACNAVWRDYNLCLSNLECDEFISFLDGSDACDKEYMAWAECNGLVFDFEAE